MAQDALDDGLQATALVGATQFTVPMLAVASTETNLSPARFNAYWLYHWSVGGASYQQRLIGRDSYVPSTGFVGVQPGMSIASAGDIIELTSKFPCAGPPFSGEPSYLSLGNAALRKMLVPDRITVPITTGQLYQPPTWLRPERLQRDEDGRLCVLEPGPTGGVAVNCAWRRPKLIAYGTGYLLTLDVPFENAGNLLILDVLRPADTLIAKAATGGAFVDSSIGLNLDTDQAKVEPAEWLEIFLAEAYRALANRDDSALWTPRWEAQDKIARSQPHYDRGSQAPAQEAA